MSGFATTQWTLVFQAASDPATPGRNALGQLMESYWIPLYAFARHRGLSSADAEDATQDFLCRITESDFLEKADPAKGRFRTFLLTAWKRFLIVQYRKESREHRGGLVRHWSIDTRYADQQCNELVSQSVAPEDAFTIQWAKSILAEARRRIEGDYAASDRKRFFQSLVPWLTKPMEASQYEKLEAELRMSRSALKVGLHRMRQRFGGYLREVISETVDDPQDIESELLELLRVTSNATPTHYPSRIP